MLIADESETVVSPLVPGGIDQKMTRAVVFGDVVRMLKK
jgi:hypothetical protein